MKKIFLTLSSTWIFLIVFYLKEVFSNKLSSSEIITICKNYFQYDQVKFWVLILGILIMCIVPVIISKFKKNETIIGVKLIELSDNVYIPVYLGYFFVSMNTENYNTMIVFYLIIFAFIYISGAEYFNPVFLFMGYHIYKVESNEGVQIILILKSKNIVRSSNELRELKVHRINNLTYIGELENND